MGAPPWANTEDEFLRQNFGTMTAKQLAAKMGSRTKKAVDHRMAVLGLEKPPKLAGHFRSAIWEKRLTERVGEPISDWLRRRYVSEEASYRDIAKELGINTRSIMRLIRAAGITPITPSVAAKRQILKNPENIKKCIAATNGRGASANKAKVREANWKGRLSQGEWRLYDAMTEAGLNPVPEMAFDKFNIDFAFIEAKLAVELDPRWHSSPEKKALDVAKDAMLTASGWTVLRLDARASTSWMVTKVVAALKRLAASQPPEVITSCSGVTVTECPD